MTLPTRLAELVRRHPRVREYAGRAVDAVVALVAGAGVSPPGLRAGTWAARSGPALDELPIVVLECARWSQSDLAALVHLLPRVSADAGGCRFVLVVAGPQLAVGGRAGVVVEQLLGPQEWSRRHDPDGWGAYREQQLAPLVRTYRPARVVNLGEGLGEGLDAGAADPVADLVARLRQAPSLRAPLSPWQRALARAERLLDPPARPGPRGGRAARSPRR